VAGKTPLEVEQEIIDRIKNRAIDPQVVAALVTVARAAKVEV
jgi:protein involved in polysaccharide export with SLBB domain